MSSASDKIAKGRAGLILDQPFFGSLALRLTPVEDPTVATAWTDGKSLGFSPDFIDSLPLDQVKGLLCHEIMHCANQHTTRRGDRDKKRWNVACDLAINPIIEACGLSLPPGGLNDPSYRDLSAEEIYGRLPSESEGGGKGDSDAGGDSEDQNTDPGGCGEVRDNPGGEDDNSPASEAEKRQAEQEWKIAVAQAATQAKQAGELPAGLGRMIEDIVDPKLDWREVLRRFVDTSARNDYQWFPPNRRHVHNGFYFPSARSEELGSITVAVDTSGSVNVETLNQFAAELTDIVGKFRASTKVIYCDTHVDEAAVQDFGPDELPLELKPVGFGGTDFRPPFDYIEREGVQPVCMIYFTDGYCDRFPEEPAYPVLWAIYGRNERFTPPFGEVVGL